MTLSNIISIVCLAIAGVLLLTALAMGQPLFIECGVNTGC